MIQRHNPSPKLQKFLAELGLGSRREIETWIKLGRIMVNDHPAQLGERVNLNDKIRLDGRLVDFKHLKSAEPEIKVLIYHKPAGEITSRRDTQDRPTVFDKLPKLRNKRWIAIGRLDFNTSGLLLFTTDGNLAHRLMHPSSEIEREYAVRILGKLHSAQVHRLKQGVRLEDGKAKFDDIQIINETKTNCWYQVVLKEGRNREVRRLFESQGLQVNRLIRTRFGPIGLPKSLHRGQSRLLTIDQIHTLQDAVQQVTQDQK